MIIAVFLSSLLLGRCDIYSGPDTPFDPPDQTKIVRVEVEPNPVVKGDTARFVCIIEDSLDTRFSFVWQLSGPGGGRFITDENTLPWIAPTGIPDTTYTHLVTADNAAEDSARVSMTFRVTVISSQRAGLHTPP